MASRRASATAATRMRVPVVMRATALAAVLLALPGAAAAKKAASKGASDCTAKAVYPDGSEVCLLYTSPSPRDQRGSRMPSSA